MLNVLIVVVKTVFLYVKNLVVLATFAMATWGLIVLGYELYVATVRRLVRRHKKN